MSYAITRTISMGIAKQVGDTPASSPSYQLLLESFEVNTVANKARNKAMLGGVYETNATRVVSKYTEISFKAKVDENSLPLFLSQNFSINTALVGGETAVYKHTLTLDDLNATKSFTLFVQNPSVSSFKIPSFKFESIEFEFPRDGFVTANIKGRGGVEVAWAGSNSLNGIREFVGADANLHIANEGVSPVLTTILSLAFKMSFGLTDFSTEQHLGSLTSSIAANTVHEYQADVTAHYADTAIQDDFVADTKKAVNILVIDTTRFITGSVASTRPSIKFICPSTSMEDWKRTGSENELQKQSFKLIALDNPTIANAPLSLEITNSVSTY